MNVIKNQNKNKNKDKNDTTEREWIPVDRNLVGHDGGNRKGILPIFDLSYLQSLPRK